MARPTKPRGLRKQRRVLTYDRAFRGQTLLTRVDIILGNTSGTQPPTPITPLYALRLIPSFNVPKRPLDVTLRRLTVCLTQGGIRTVYMPYVPIDNSHNAMLQEYDALIPNEDYEAFIYRGEDFVL